LNLGYNSYENNKTMFLFTEKRQVELAKDLSIQMLDVTGQRTSQFAEKTLAAGARVDCYLLHLDLHESNSPVNKVHIYRGRLKFNQPILGFIISGESLNGTDDLFGNPGTIYYQNPRRGILSKPDWFVISDDHCTLDIELHLKNAEEMRILVASDEENKIN